MKCFNITVADTISEPTTKDGISWKNRLHTANTNIDIITLRESGLIIITRLKIAVIIAIRSTMKLFGISASNTP